MMDRPESRILVFGGGFLPGTRDGGPTQTMVKRLAACPGSVACDVIVRDREAGDLKPYPGLSGRAVPFRQHTIHYINVRDPRHWVRLIARLRGRQFLAWSIHNLWGVYFALAPAVLSVVFRQLRLVCISPHGQLAQGALARRARIKKILLPLWRALMLHPKFLVVASSAREMQQIQEAIPGCRAITSDGSLAVPPNDLATCSGDIPRMIFLSRIHPIKNLHLLLQALKGIDQPFILDLYGPLVDAEYWERCQELIRELDGPGVVSYRGEVAPSEVAETFSRYDLFVLPTQTENFGNVISESLAAGCPVMCSPNTPWTSVLSSGAGSIVQPLDGHGFHKAVLAAVSQDATTRTAAKDRALQTYRRYWEDSRQPSLFEIAADVASARA